VGLPLSYNLRNFRVRWPLTLLAVFSIALVVAVCTVLLAMSEGFTMALRSTGNPGNAIIVMRGSGGEAMSSVPLEHRQRILDKDGLARGPDGRVLASWEWLISISQPRKSDGRRTNVTLRAVPPQAFEVRGGIRLAAGRPFTPGLPEVIVGRRILQRLRGLALGGMLRCARKEMKVVGVFESSGAAFESEIWGDYDAMTALFRRGAGSNSLVVRMKDPAAIPDLDRWIRAQPDMQLQAVPETQYYEEQAGPVAHALKLLAALVALVMGVGAVFGTMNTMYGIVAARTREIATLRAVGFSRRDILVAFVVESVILAVTGGGLGCLVAFAAHGYTTGTANLQTLSELAFAFRITPMIVASTLSFAVVVGILGGLLPALQAARVPIAAALRDVRT
jgi:putative ABC transport system permease protein